jgi:hypothetical protein
VELNSRGVAALGVDDDLIRLIYEGWIPQDLTSSRVRSLDIERGQLTPAAHTAYANVKCATGERQRRLDNRAECW